MLFSALAAVTFAAVPAAAHLAAWHSAMYGFNWTAHHPGWANPGAYDNRPLVPLMGRTFTDWWMHGQDHIALPPNDGDYLELPAGGKFLVQVACDKGATDYYNSSDGGDIRDGDWPCPNSGSDEWHTKDITDTKGCGFGIAYKSDINSVTPNDITIFTVNYTCPWYRYQWFDVPADLPPCDDCICTFNWIHSPDDGSMQMYQNGYKCKVLNDGPGKQLQTPQLARRCGEDPTTGTPAVPSNCTGGVNGGAKLGLYWLQADGNNMFEGYYDPPYYNGEYGFTDGAQNDIFVSDGSPAPTSTADATSSTSSSSSAAASVTVTSVSTGAPTPAADVQSTSAAAAAPSSGDATTTAVATSSTSTTTAAAAGSAATPDPQAAAQPQPQGDVTAASPSTGSGSGSGSCPAQRKRGVSEAVKGKKKKRAAKKDKVKKSQKSQAKKSGDGKKRGTTKRGHEKRRVGKEIH